MSTLYIVGTPIGNLEDISLRALRILKEVDFILAEDTRVSRKLLNHFDIKTKVLSFHEHSKEDSYLKIFELLHEGKNLALVTDAGTPGISDPGAKLVARIREENRANNQDIKIESIPGPSSLTTAISISGLQKSNFYFTGFAPHKKGRQTFFKNIKNKIDEETAFIFFESPHRILKALESLVEFCPDYNVMVAKELTKIFEEVVSGKPAELIEFFNNNSDKLRGEFVVIVY